MKTVAFVNQKGGVGKTSLAASLAVAAQEAGERVFVVDLDPQGSLMGWAGRRQADTPAVDRITPDKLPAALSALRVEGYTIIVIDTPGLDSAGTSVAMSLADLCIIPARASVLDIEASRSTLAALSRLGRPYAFVLNCAPVGRTNRPLDAARALTLMGVLSAVSIAMRSDHMDAIALGLGVTEFNTTGKAADEIRQLWAWIVKRLGA